MEKIGHAGLSVSAISAPYGNWASRITDPFPPVLDSARRTLARLRAHRIPFLRVMSWPNAGLAEDAWREEAIARTRALAEIAAEHGVTLVLENCDGWAARAHSTSPNSSIA